VHWPILDVPYTLINRADPTKPVSPSGKEQVAVSISTDNGQTFTAAAVSNDLGRHFDQTAFYDDPANYWGEIKVATWPYAGRAIVVKLTFESRVSLRPGTVLPNLFEIDPPSWGTRDDAVFCDDPFLITIGVVCDRGA
jgi:hypothetical protein